MFPKLGCSVFRIMFKIINTHYKAIIWHRHFYHGVDYNSRKHNADICNATFHEISQATDC